MNCYNQWILPRLLDLGMKNKEAARYRARLVPAAYGKTLEVGVGSGLNLPFYGNGVDRLYAIDPSEALLRMARKKARTVPFSVEFLARSGEEIPIDDRSIDTVVTTWTLTYDDSRDSPSPGTVSSRIPSAQCLLRAHAHSPRSAATRRRFRNESPVVEISLGD